MLHLCASTSDTHKLKSLLCRLLFSELFAFSYSASNNITVKSYFNLKAFIVIRTTFTNKHISQMFVRTVTSVNE